MLFVGDRLDPDGNDYPVLAIGVPCHAVEGWEDTADVPRRSCSRRCLVLTRRDAVTARRSSVARAASLRAPAWSERSRHARAVRPRRRADRHEAA